MQPLVCVHASEKALGRNCVPCCCSDVHEAPHGGVLRDGKGRDGAKPAVSVVVCHGVAERERPATGRNSGGARSGGRWPFSRINGCWCCYVIAGARGLRDAGWLQGRVHLHKGESRPHASLRVNLVVGGAKSLLTLWTWLIFDQADNLGHIIDTRNKETAPTFENFSRMPAAQVKELLIQVRSWPIDFRQLRALLTLSVAR